MEAFKANLRQAIKNRETVTIAGGFFDHVELQKVLTALIEVEQKDNDYRNESIANTALRRECEALRSAKLAADERADGLAAVLDKLAEKTGAIRGGFAGLALADGKSAQAAIIAQALDTLALAFHDRDSHAAGVVLSDIAAQAWALESMRAKVQEVWNEDVRKVANIKPILESMLYDIGQLPCSVARDHPAAHSLLRTYLDQGQALADMIA